MRALLVALVMMVVFAAPAQADIGGSVPSPGGCDYPATGIFGAAMGEYDYGCQMPVEINGARWTTLFGGGMWQVNANLGVTFMMFTASIGVQFPAGVLRGISYWACPDMSMADQPNPVGAWNKKITPTPCKTLAPMPQLLRDGMPAPPPGAPEPPPPPPQIFPNVAEAPLQPQTGAQTNPTPGNPVAPEPVHSR